MFAETTGAFAVGKEKKGLGKSEQADTLQHSHAEESGALLADLEEGRRGSEHAEFSCIQHLSLCAALSLGSSGSGIGEEEKT